MTSISVIFYKHTHELIQANVVIAADAATIAGAATDVATADDVVPFWSS